MSKTVKEKQPKPKRIFFKNSKFNSIYIICLFVSLIASYVFTRLVFNHDKFSGLFNFSSTVNLKAIFATTALFTAIIMIIGYVIYYLLKVVQYKKYIVQERTYVKEKRIGHHVCPSCGKQPEVKYLVCPHTNTCKNSGRFGKKKLCRLSTISAPSKGSIKYAIDQSEHASALCPVSGEKNYFACPHMNDGLCPNQNCYIQLFWKKDVNIDAYESKNYGDVTIESVNLRNFDQAYMNCPLFEDLQEYKLYFHCTDEYCKYTDCALNKATQGANIAPTVSIPKSFTCKNNHKFYTTVKKNMNEKIRIVDQNNVFVRESLPLTTFCNSCTGDMSYSANMAINSTFLLVGLRSSGKTSFIMSLYDELSALIASSDNIYDAIKKKNVSDRIIHKVLGLHKNEGKELDFLYDDNRDKYTIYSTAKLAQTQTRDAKNVSLILEDKYIINLNDRSGETMSERERLINSIPEKYDGLIYIFDPYSIESFINYYNLDKEFIRQELGTEYTQIEGVLKDDDIIYNLNENTMPTKKVAFVINKCDKRFDTPPYLSYKGKGLEILEHEIGYNMIMSLQELFYYLRNDYDVDSYLNKLLDTPTGQLIFKALCDLNNEYYSKKKINLLGRSYNVSDKLAKKYEEMIKNLKGESTGTASRRRSTATTRTDDKQELSAEKREQIKNTLETRRYFIENISGGAGSVNNAKISTKMYLILKEKIAKQILDDNGEINRKNAEIVAEANDMMNIACIAFMIVYERANTVSKILTDAEGRPFLEDRRRFFSASSVRKDQSEYFSIIDVNDDEKRTRDEKISIPRVSKKVDKRDLNPFMWLIEEKDFYEEFVTKTNYKGWK